MNNNIREGIRAYMTLAYFGCVNDNSDGICIILIFSGLLSKQANTPLTAYELREPMV